MSNFRRYTFKLYPNAVQSGVLDRLLYLHRNLWNGLIQQRVEAYRRQVDPLTGKGKWLRARGEQSREITLLRADDPEYRELSSDSLQVTNERAEQAYKAYCANLAAYPEKRRQAKVRGETAPTPPSPPFKGRHFFCGFGYKKHGSGWRFDFDATNPNGRRAGGKSGKLYLKGVPGLIRARGRLPFTPESIVTCDLKLNGGDWWLSLVVEAPMRELPTGTAEGSVEFNLIDSFATVRVANGGHAAGPKDQVFTWADGRIILLSEERNSTSVPATPEMGADRGQWRAGLAEAVVPATPEMGADRGGNLAGLARSAVPATPEVLQQRMARCKKGSCLYRKLRARKARLEARAARRRREASHIWTTGIARQFRNISIVKPSSIKEATKSGRGDQHEHGAEVELKATMNRHVLNQAPAAAIGMIQYKVAERGGSVKIVESDDAPIGIGNAVVEARKSNRKLRKAIKQCTKTCKNA